MDRLSIQSKIKDVFGKYKFVLLILCVGLLLMLLPGKTEEEEITKEPQSIVEKNFDITDQLQNILSRLEGAGRVEVMLTVSTGEMTVYQCDNEVSGGETGSNRQNTVIVTDRDRAQSGLIKQVNPPVYLGAVIVCQGADSAAVRLAVIDAVSKATGLGTDKISVLKMK